MIGKVVVMEYSDYQAWLRGVPREKSPAEAGQQLFTSLACSNCHLENNSGRGPSLQNLFGTEVKIANGAAVKADETYLRESILNPGAKTVAGYTNDMPTFQGLVTEEQVAMIIQYIKSIGPKHGEAGPTTSPAPAAPAPAQGVGRPAPPQAAKPAAPQGEQQR
jgi:cytochrome c oxidase subunit 2